MNKAEKPCIIPKDVITNKKLFECYYNAIETIQEKYPKKSRQWCHDQLNRALDNTEFLTLEGMYEIQINIIIEILYIQFGIGFEDEL